MASCTTMQMENRRRNVDMPIQETDATRCGLYERNFIVLEKKHIILLEISFKKIR